MPARLGVVTWDDTGRRADVRARTVRPQEYAEWVAWQVAWQQALYGEAGFYRRDEGPAGHFRTASHAAPDVLAAALLRLAADHGCTAVVDVGAGRGELLRALDAAGATDATGRRVRLHGVDVVPRPSDVPGRIGWSEGLDRVDAATLAGALVVAWELLDTVPCPVLEVDDDGVLRVVLVEPATGRERLGPPAGEEELAWTRRWWPADGLEEGDRIEVGAPRDAAWAALVGRAPAGTVLLAVDYAHTVADRPAPGTLAGYRAGRLVPPRPDGSCDVTAHVAIDAVAAAGQGAGARTLVVTTQREALRDLGVRAPSDAGDPAHLAAASRVAELLDPQGLGGFIWLLQQRSG